MTDDTKLILGRIEEMDERLTGRMDKMESRMDGMESRMDGMESRMDGMESEISSLKLTIENVTNHNIQVIAEGHLDLSRKLDEALKSEAEKEINKIRLNILEDKVEKIEKVVFA